MPGEITINITSEWRPTEPDGEPCSNCGDRCFLRQHTFFLRLQTHLDHSLPIAGLQLCGACYDALRPQLLRIRPNF